MLRLGLRLRSCPCAGWPDGGVCGLRSDRSTSRRSCCGSGLLCRRTAPPYVAAESWPLRCCCAARLRWVSSCAPAAGYPAPASAAREPANITPKTAHRAIVRDIFMKSASWRLRLCDLPSNLISGLYLKRRSFWRPAPLPISGRARFADARISSRTSWNRFWLWGLSSSRDRRIFPEKFAPSVRYRSTCGKCSRGGSREPCARGPFW